MTIATVQSVARRFLTEKTPGVLAVKGDWGVGKTYMWNRLIDEMKGQIHPRNYCYVSLFGVSSMRDLRTSIYTKTNPFPLEGETGLKRILGKGCNALNWLGRKTIVAKNTFQLKDIPYVKYLHIDFEAVAGNLVKDTVICLDDFERLDSKCIKPEELLGFISELKEEKGCKVVLIFNEDKLGANKNTYQKYREKVIDLELLYAPTAEEAFALAVPKDMPCREIAERCAAKLKMTNIRILRKIVKLTTLMHEQEDTWHSAVLDRAVKVVVFLAWCHYDQNETKPTLDFISGWGSYGWALHEQTDKSADPKREKWAKTIQDYELQYFDEFDKAILKIIERGYLEETGFVEEAKALDIQVRARELQDSYSAAWRLFRCTFDDNTDEFVHALSDSFRKSVCLVGPVDMNRMVTILRELGHVQLADELIEYFIANRAGERKLFDLKALSYSGGITDEVIRKRFKIEFAKSHVDMPLGEAIEHFSTHDSWTEEQIETMRRATAEDFYAFFKQDNGDALVRHVKASLQFDGWSSYESIGEATRTALIRIGRECRINAIRVRELGITDAQLAGDGLGDALV